MIEFENYAQGVDLSLLAHHGVDKEEFKAASGQVLRMIPEAEALIAQATFNKGIFPRDVYLAHQGDLGSGLVRYLVDQALGKDRVRGVFDRTRLSESSTLVSTLAFLDLHGGPLIHFSGDLRNLPYKIRIDGSIGSSCGGSCACSGSDTPGECCGSNDGSTCCGSGSCNQEGGHPSLKPLKSWNMTQVWAAYHRLRLPYSTRYLPPKVKG